MLRYDIRECLVSFIFASIATNLRRRFWEVDFILRMKMAAAALVDYPYIRKLDQKWLRLYKAEKGREVSNKEVFPPGNV